MLAQGLEGPRGPGRRSHRFRRVSRVHDDRGHVSLHHDHVGGKRRIVGPLVEKSPVVVERLLEKITPQRVQPLCLERILVGDLPLEPVDSVAGLVEILLRPHVGGDRLGRRIG